MMSDIVERLRDGVAREASGHSALWDSIMAEAADEIEGLREGRIAQAREIGKANAAIKTLSSEGGRKEYETKEAILNRLHKKVGLCGYCGKPACGHGSNTTLPGRLNMQDAIDAIDLNSVSDKRDIGQEILDSVKDLKRTQISDERSDSENDNSAPGRRGESDG